MKRPYLILGFRTRPFSEKSRKGLATRNTLPCQGIKSVTQAGVNVYTLGGAVSVLCLVCDDEALVESIEQYKQSTMMEGSCDRSSCSKRMSTEMKASTAFLSWNC